MLSITYHPRVNFIKKKKYKYRGRSRDREHDDETNKKKPAWEERVEERSQKLKGTAIFSKANRLP